MHVYDDIVLFIVYFIYRIEMIFKITRLSNEN